MRLGRESAGPGAFRSRREGRGPGGGRGRTEHGDAARHRRRGHRGGRRWGPGDGSPAGDVPGDGDDATAPVPVPVPVPRPRPRGGRLAARRGGGRSSALAEPRRGPRASPGSFATNVFLRPPVLVFFGEVAAPSPAASPVGGDPAAARLAAASARALCAPLLEADSRAGLAGDGGVPGAGDDGDGATSAETSSAASSGMVIPGTRVPGSPPSRGRGSPVAAAGSPSPRPRAPRRRRRAIPGSATPTSVFRRGGVPERSREPRDDARSGRSADRTNSPARPSGDRAGKGGFVAAGSAAALVAAGSAAALVSASPPATEAGESARAFSLFRRRRRRRRGTRSRAP